jgi:hypothetical protein
VRCAEIFCTSGSTNRELQWNHPTPRSPRDRYVGARSRLHEPVFMAPQSIRAAQLLVHEAMRRPPSGDFALPADGEAKQAELVADSSAAAHLNRERRDDGEFEERRGEALEILRISEKLEGLLDGERQRQLLQ